MATGTTSETRDRPTHAHRRVHASGLVEDRGAHARHTLLPLGHTLRPSSPPDVLQNGVIDRRMTAPFLYPREQDFPSRTESERQDRPYRHRVPKPRRSLDRRHTDPGITLPHV